MFRRKANTIAIFALNLLLGWTFIGWIVSLVWSLTSEKKPQTIVINNHVSADKAFYPSISQPIQENLQNLPNTQSFSKPQHQLESSDIKSHQDKINQLKQLKQLLDAGILTQDEFNIQKTQILDS